MLDRTNSAAREIEALANAVAARIDMFDQSGQALVQAVTQLAPLVPYLNPEFAYSFKCILAEMAAAARMMAADGMGHAARLRVVDGQK